MTKITTDAQAISNIQALIDSPSGQFMPALERRAAEALAHIAARLASTSPAPDGWALPDHKVDDEDPEGFNNGWNCCLSAVRKAIGAPQPVVENGNG